MGVDLIIEDDRWKDAAISTLAERAVGAALAHLGYAPDDWEIALLACDNVRIAALNADFRGKPQPTNVLSWPSAERGSAKAGVRPAPPEPHGDPELGDIALAYETCFAEAKAAGRPVADHLTHLIVHGTLHLLGYDHIRKSDGDLMEATEIAILAKLGVPNPYESAGPDGSE